MNTYTVWHCEPRFFNYERAAKRLGLTDHTVEADSPLEAAEKWCKADMERRGSFTAMTVAVCKNGRLVAAVEVRVELVRHYKALEVNHV